MCGVAVTAAVLVGSGGLQAQSSEYLDYEALTRELRSLANGSGNASMRSIATSHEGREVWLVEVGNPTGIPVDERPAVLVVGNLAGDHVVGSQLALEIIRFLLNDASAASVLTGQMVYVVPRLNPDGAEAMFASVLRDATGNGFSYDDDNDGRFDEDPGEDLNGDGLITLMRVLDPSGDFMLHPDDSRLMKRADKAEGETGTHTLYTEGVDSDGDGFLNEDGVGGVDLDRNFQHEHPYYQADAGLNMVSEPESRGLMDFLAANRHIGAVLTFGHSDNLVTTPDAAGRLADASVIDLVAFAAEATSDVLTNGVFGGGGGFGFGFGFGRGGATGARGAPIRGAQPGSDNDPQSGRRPAVTVNQEDLEYFSAVSEAYKEITGITEVGVNRKAEGAFFQVAYFQFGIPAFSTQGWGIPEAAPDDEDSGAEESPGDEESPVDEEDPSDEEDPGDEESPGEEDAAARRGRAGGGSDGSLDAKLLEAMEGAGIEAFVDWSPFEHPDLGSVEIGGFVPYATTNPPAEQLPELGRQHGAFVVRLARMLPRVSIVETSVTAHGGGVFTVSVEIENSGFFPTSLRHGVVSRSVQPTIVRIQVDADAILTGDAKSSRVTRLEGSGSRAGFSWVIRGNTGQSIEIWVRSQKGGTDTATVTLR